MKPKEDRLLFVNGEPIRYNELHRRIRKNNGNAPHCSKCSVNGRRFEWALIKGREYSENIGDYIPLCPSCHRKYDMTESIRKNMREKMKGKNRDGFNPAARKVINEESGVVFETVSLAAKSVNLKRTTLIAMMSGQNKNKTNLKYYEQS